MIYLLAFNLLFLVCNFIALTLLVITIATIREGERYTHYESNANSAI